MALKIEANKSITKKKDFGRVDEGTYPARVVQIVDLGNQVQTDWQTGDVLTYDDGNPIIKPEVYINFEFPTERVEIDGEDRPRWAGKQYTLSLHEKAALTALMKAVANGSTNVADALGQACTVTIGSTSGGNAKVTGVSPLMKGMSVPELENPATIFDFDSPSKEAWNVLPNWMKDKITASPDYGGSKLEKMVEGFVDDGDDDKPFNPE